MRPSLAPSIAAAALVAALLPSCSDRVAEPVAQASVELATPAADAHGLPQGSEPLALDPADFSTTIDNPWWPMTPGTTWVYEETDSEGTVERVEVTVTERTKVVAAGIEARVVRDVVTQGGQLVEDTFDWYAQDRAGNVWYLGEDTKEYDKGEFVGTAGSWEAGVDGAQAGILMPGDPQPGMAYRQEYYAGEAEDEAAVLSTSEFVQVPSGLYRDVVLTRDSNALEPRVLEYKFYARGTGPVLVVQVSGGTGREALVTMTH